MGKKNDREKNDELKECLEELKTIDLKALSEMDIDSFIEILLRRDALVKYILKNNVVLDEEDTMFFLELENNILDRLEEEKKKIINDLAVIGKKRRAINRYSPKYPFPPMPAFFDRKG